MMKRKNGKNGKDLLKKGLSLLIDAPPGTKEYHTHLQRLNRNLEREMKHKDNYVVVDLAKRADELFRDMETVLTKRRLLV